MYRGTGVSQGKRIAENAEGSQGAQSGGGPSGHAGTGWRAPDEFRETDCHWPMYHAVPGWLRTDGRVWVTSHADAFDEPAAQRYLLELDENGQKATLGPWSGTNTNGTPSTFNCLDWSSTSGTLSGREGRLGHATSEWIQSNSVSPCDEDRPIYCLGTGAPSTPSVPDPGLRRIFVGTALIDGDTAPTTMDAILPSYLYRYRPYGQYARMKPGIDAAD